MLTLSDVHSLQTHCTLTVDSESTDCISQLLVCSCSIDDVRRTVCSNNLDRAQAFGNVNVNVKVKRIQGSALERMHTCRIHRVRLVRWLIARYDRYTMLTSVKGKNCTLR